MSTEWENRKMVTPQQAFKDLVDACEKLESIPRRRVRQRRAAKLARARRIEEAVLSFTDLSPQKKFEIMEDILGSPTLPRWKVGMQAVDDMKKIENRLRRGNKP